MVSDNPTAERMSQAVDTTRAEASQVKDTAAEQARAVAQQAREQARSTMQSVQYDLRDRADEEAKKFAQTLHDTSRQLHSMASSSSDQSFVATLVREGADAAERLASRMEIGTDALLADVRSWARRNPGGFLLGAAVGGFLLGRLVRNFSGDANGQPTAANMRTASSNVPNEEFWESGNGGSPMTRGVVE